MTGILCALLMAWAQASEPSNDPEVLTAQLGSMKYAERQAAAEKLERLGRPALPALRAARRSKDLEVRMRAISLVRKIEASVLIEPTLLKLDFQDVTLADVLASLSKQAGFKIKVFPETLPRWKSQKLTLKAPGPVPFWEAVDRLCRASQLRENPDFAGMGGNREPMLALSMASPQPLYPVWDHGPFRIHLIRLRYERDVTFGVVAPGVPRPPANNRPVDAPGPVAETPTVKPNAVINVQCSVQLQVLAEPRLAMKQNGTIQIVEAVDDLGNTLAPPALAARERRTSMPIAYSRQFGGVSGHRMQPVVYLKRPDAPGSKIRILKGIIPLMLDSRGPDPLVVALPTAAGKTFDNVETSATVHGIRKDPNMRQTSIELSVRSSGESNLNLRDGMGLPLGRSLPSPNLPYQQVEILDNQGRVLHTSQTAIDAESGRLTLTLNHAPDAGVPAELRIYSLTHTAMNLPFEFRDIVMP